MFQEDPQLAATLQGNPNLAALMILLAQLQQQQQGQQAQGQQLGGGLLGGYMAGKGLKGIYNSITGSGTPALAPPKVVSIGGKAPVKAPLFGNFSQMGIGPQAGILAGGLAIGKGLKDMYNRKSGTGSLEGLAGRASLGIATGGLSELARGFGVGKKSTQDYRAERKDALRETAPAAYDYLNKAYKTAEQNNNTWQDGKYKGEKWSFEKAKELAKEDPTHFIGVMGNMETFGDDWINTSQDQQREFVRRALNENLYSSDKGNVIFSGKKGHQDRAREIYNEVKSGGGTPSRSPSGWDNQTAPNPSAVEQVRARYGDQAAANYNEAGGVGGPGYEPDPDRPGHYRLRR